MKITVTYELEITDERLAEIYADEFITEMRCRLKGIDGRSAQENLVHGFVLGQDNHGENPNSIGITHIHVTD